ncbi:aldo/keto reductase [Pelomyxa schiedti]|nr:aldo/keto reductase [Pelomyxa schiedti]
MSSTSECESVALRLSGTGDMMPRVGFGTWLAQKNVVGEAVKLAISCGYRHIDCAEKYGNEEEIGQAIAAAMAENHLTRNQLWLTSKLWSTHHAPEDVRPALLKTLSDLGVSYLDLYLIHFPLSFTKDAPFPPQPEHYIEIPTIDTWREMEKLVDDGLVRNIGVSNFSCAKIEKFWDQCRIKPSVNQFELHPMLPQAKLREYCKLRNICVTGYGSLLNNGSPFRGTAPNLLLNPTILKVAAKHRRSPAQVLLRWGIQMNAIVIPKSTTRERIMENSQLWDFSLDNDDLGAIYCEDRHFRIGGNIFLNGKTPDEFWDYE